MAKFPTLDETTMLLAIYDEVIRLGKKKELTGAKVGGFWSNDEYLINDIRVALHLQDDQTTKTIYTNDMCASKTNNDMVIFHKGNRDTLVQAYAKIFNVSDY